MKTHVQHVVNTVEVEEPKLIKETVQRKKPIVQEKINQVTKHIDVPKRKKNENNAEICTIFRPIPCPMLFLSQPVFLCVFVCFQLDLSSSRCVDQ